MKENNAKFVAYCKEIFNTLLIVIKANFIVNYFIK